MASDLSTGVEEKTPYGSEDDSNYEEERQNRLGCKNGPADCSVSGP